MDDPALPWLLSEWDGTGTPEAYLRSIGIILEIDRKPTHIASRRAQLLSLDNSAIPLDKLEATPIIPVDGRRRRRSRRRRDRRPGNERPRSSGPGS